MTQQQSQQFVKVRVQVPGQHHWPDAPSEVAFLRNLHRHVFTVEVELVVGHGDREVEFFMCQRALEAFLRARWAERLPMLHFGAMSCEMIAQVVLDEFEPQPRRVTVWEDGENAGGAERLS